MSAASLVTLKLNRIEVGVAVVALLGLTGWATVAVVNAAAVHVPAACFALLASSAPENWGVCRDPLYAWADAHANAGDYFRESVEFIPFAVAALVGVPIAARELEARTAPLTWSLNPSRTRWLVRQLVPIGLLVGVAAAMLALAAAALEHDWDVWGGGQPDVVHIGHYGPGLVARMFGGFGLAVAAGALLGRQLPAFLLAFGLALGSVNALTGVRDAWFASHEQHVLDVPGVATSWAWRTPAGAVLANSEAVALAPPGTDPQTWLSDHAYNQVAVGISIETAMGWVPYEAAAYVGLGVVSIGGAVFFVNRRRPA